MEFKSTLQLKGVIIGMILGDGWLDWRGNNARLEVSSVSKGYIEWKKKILERITSVKMYERKNNRWSDKPLFRIQTKVHPIYSKLYPHLYHNRKRTIDEYSLKSISPLGLLIWYLDDGSCSYNKEKKNGMNLTIATNSYNMAEHLLMAKVLNDKFRLRFNIHQHFQRQRGKRYLHLTLKAIDKIRFYEMVFEPYLKEIPEEMKYKIPAKGDIIKIDKFCRERNLYNEEIV